MYGICMHVVYIKLVVMRCCLQCLRLDAAAVFRASPLVILVSRVSDVSVVLIFLLH